MLKWITSIVLCLGAAQAAPGSSYSGSGDQLQLQNMDASAPPEFYLVQPGDTLWEISSTFLGNPYYWPRLWSINDYITNPHWIYPGNRIVFRMGTLIDPPSVDLDANRDGYTVEGLDYEDVGAECGPDIRFDGHIEATKFQAPAFISHRRDVEIFGTISKARSNQVMLAEDNLVYVKVDDPDAYECGDILAAFRRVKKSVRHPNSWWTKYGSMYRILGNLKVVHKNGDYLSAMVRDSYIEMERGDLVGPPMPVTVELEVDKPTGDLEGTVIARMSTGSNLAATGEVVFIDRGRSDGVRVGSSFYVVQRRDEMLDKRRPDIDLPPSVIGRIVVVRVDDYSSTGVITDAARSLPDGAEIMTRVN
jgi:hypothetical protein